MVGHNQAGRFLVAAIEHMYDTHWRLITAFWMSRPTRIRRYYGEE
jgi:hypothetical protein